MYEPIATSITEPRSRNYIVDFEFFTATIRSYFDWIFFCFNYLKELFLRLSGDIFPTQSYIITLNLNYSKLQRILAYDNLHSKAEAEVTAGGIGYTYVNLRLKSEPGVGLDYDIGIYSWRFNNCLLNMIHADKLDEVNSVRILHNIMAWNIACGVRRWRRCVLTRVKEWNKHVGFFLFQIESNISRESSVVGLCFVYIADTLYCLNMSTDMS